VTRTRPVGEFPPRPVPFLWRCCPLRELRGGGRDDHLTNARDPEVPIKSSRRRWRQGRPPHRSASITHDHMSGSWRSRALGQRFHNGTRSNGVFNPTNGTLEVHHVVEIGI
jgi:hypothetical protein